MVQSGLVVFFSIFVVGAVPCARRLSLVFEEKVGCRRGVFWPEKPVLWGEVDGDGVGLGDVSSKIS